MPFIIWGSRGITSTLENGTFFCPGCNQERDYALKRELRAFWHGNFGAAEAWDARRRREQREVNGIRSDLYRDRVDLARDRAELRWDLRHY